MDIEFPYREEESDIFDRIKRPRIKVEIFSQTTGAWGVIDEVLVDTGADFCVLPRLIGNLLVEDITQGKYTEIKGVVPGVRLIAYLHELRIKLGGREFTAPVAIADSDDVPCIFGRVRALDLFDANFIRGERIGLRD
jgi:predicted aspartyl protease